MLLSTIPRLTTTYLTTWLRENIPNQRGKTVLVTGATDGIGFWIAMIFAQFGAHVLLGCRNKAKGLRTIKLIQQDHPHARCSLALVDLANPASIEACCTHLLHSLDSLDILINNAGISADAESFTDEGIDLTFATNHLGTHALTAQLLPLLLATPAARIVTQTSLTHKLLLSAPNYEDFCQRYQPQSNSYAKSKLANLLFAKHLHSTLQQEGYSQTSLASHPGLSFTNINRHAHTTATSDFINDLKTLSLHRMALRTANKLRLCQPFQLAAALPCVYAAACQQPHESFYYGPDSHFELCGLPTSASPSSLVHDNGLIKRLMHITEKITGQSLRL